MDSSHLYSSGLSVELVESFRQLCDERRNKRQRVIMAAEAEAQQEIEPTLFLLRDLKIRGVDLSHALRGSYTKFLAIVERDGCTGENVIKFYKGREDLSALRSNLRKPRYIPKGINHSWYYIKRSTVVEEEEFMMLSSDTEGKDIKTLMYSIVITDADHTSAQLVFDDLGEKSKVAALLREKVIQAQREPDEEPGDSEGGSDAGNEVSSANSSLPPPVTP